MSMYFLKLALAIVARDIAAVAERGVRRDCGGTADVLAAHGQQQQPSDGFVAVRRTSIVLTGQTIAQSICTSKRQPGSRDKLRSCKGKCRVLPGSPLCVPLLR